MISRFLMAENPIEDGGAKEYILHTKSPRFLAEVIEGKLGYKFKIVQQYDADADEKTLDEIKLDMLDWWNEYLDWEEELEDSEE